MTENVHLENASCPLGCETNDAPVLTGYDRIHNLPGEFPIVKCNSCGLMRTNPRPAPQSMGRYYPDDYGPYLGTQVSTTGTESSSFARKMRRSIVNAIFKFNTQLLPPLEPGRMLEVGCASGSFLHKMAMENWLVQGIEFSEKAAKEASKLGYHVHAGALETAQQPDELFDLIVGWMVLEHLHEPIAGLKKLRECAKPDGWLVLSVPNAGSTEFRLFKDKWYALHLPNHLYHFSPKTIKKVLEASGWSIEKIHHQRVLGNMIASAGYALCDKGYSKLGQRLVKIPENAGRWNYAFYPIAWLLSMFGQTGRMTVWARAKP
jgi:2-polyprenyl-3-methyl-5-hydroxy-6-metoxy-1,4-benzoquinol methylase